MSSASPAVFSDVRAVVLDFDGVILESGEIKTEAFLKLFHLHPEHLEEIRRHHLENLGISRFRKFEWIYRELLNRSLSAEDSARLGEQYSELVFTDMLRCPFVPGARAALASIQGRLPAFVASGTPQPELRRIAQARGLGEFFDGIYGTPDTKPEILRRLSDKLRVPAERILFIGDGLSDWRAAEATGAMFLARKTPTQSNWIESTAVAWVEDLCDLPCLLGLDPKGANEVIGR